MRLVQAQLVAYRLGLQRKMQSSSSSNSSSFERRSPSSGRKNSSVSSFPVTNCDEKREETCLSDWEMMIVIWSFWIVAFLGCCEFGFLPVFFVCFLFYAMYLTLKHSRREPGEPGAYFCKIVRSYMAQLLQNSWTES